VTEAATPTAPPNTETHPPRQGQIYGLMAKVLADVQPVGKDHKAPRAAGGYAYRSIDEVYAAMHDALAKHGVVCTPTVLDRHTKYLQAKDKTRVHHVLTIRYTWTAPDGSSMTSTTVGEAMDSGDKGCNKAMTAAFKYLAFQTLCIPVAGVAIDPESDDPEAALPMTDGNGKPTDPPQAPPRSQPNRHRNPLGRLAALYARWNPDARGYSKEHVDNWLDFFGEQDGKRYERLQDLPCKKIENALAASKEE